MVENMVENSLLYLFSWEYSQSLPSKMNATPGLASLPTPANGASNGIAPTKQT